MDTKPSYKTPVPVAPILVGMALLCSATSLAQITLTLTPTDHHGYHISCFGGGDGAIDLSVSGGTPPYTYVWSTGATTQDVSDLRSGFISVEVRDAGSGLARADLTLTEPYALRATVEPYLYPSGFNISCYNCYNGSIQVTTLEGVAPYTYVWADGPSTEDRTQLDAGSYAVDITDANSCTIREDQILLTQPERDDWSKGGNAGTDPSTQFIGTTDNKDVVFKANGGESVRLKSNGDIKLGGSLTNFGLLYRDPDGILRAGSLPEYPPIPEDPCRNLSWFATHSPYWKVTGNTFAELCEEERPLLGTLGATPLSIITDNTVRLLVAVNGKVAIGGMDPDDQFEVHTTLERSGMTLNNAREDDNAHTEIRFMKEGNGRWALGCDFQGNGDQDFFLWDEIAAANRLRVDADGRVLVGNAVAQNSDLYKLYVEGGIVSRDVKVTANNFPDYVFHKNYELMPLDEVARYIDMHGHLPHMPSAAEVEAAQGVEVGDLGLRLLRTVEEQQLYILELREEVDGLRRRVAELEIR